MNECTSLSFEEIKDLIKTAGFWLLLCAAALSTISFSRKQFLKIAPDAKSGT